MPPLNKSAFYQNMARVFNRGPTVPHQVSNAMAGPGEYVGSPIGTAIKYFQNSTQNFASHMSQFGHGNRISRFAEYNSMDLYSECHSALDIYCLAGNTQIPLLGGTNETIESLYLSKKTDFYVYSYDIEARKMVPGLCKRAMKTGKNHDVYRVTFDDGTNVRLTDKHRVLLKNGQYKEVRYLQQGEAIASLYTKQSKLSAGDHIDDYEMVLQDNGKWEYTHRIIGKHTNPSGKGVIHHKDFCKWNNAPDNLEFMTWNEHKLLHARTNAERWKQNPRYAEKMKKVFSDHAKRMWANPEWKEWKRETHSKAMLEHYKSQAARDAVTRRGFKHGSYKSCIDDRVLLAQAKEFETLNDFCRNFNFGDLKFSKLQYASQFVRRRFRLYGYADWNDFKNTYRPINNHKVHSVIFDGREDVYDLEVEQYHNFAIGKEGNYVFVHNSHECTAKGEYGDFLKIHSEDPKIKLALEKLFFDILNIEFNAASWIRSLCKYGDHFLLVDHTINQGIVNVFPLPVNEIEREEGFDKDHPMEYRFRWTTRNNKILQPWEVIHFRLIGNDSYLPYGMSVLEAGRRAWRQLILMEDAVMVYRIVRAPDRRVFYIDVGNIAPNNVEAAMNKARDALKRNAIVDPTSGQVDLRYNALSAEDDFFIPTRGKESGTRIETLPGGNMASEINDLAYIQNKLFAALKIPKSYLGYEGDAGKANLSQQDVRFAHTIQQIQRVFIAELEHLAMIQLFSMGLRDEDLTNFELSMANPSTIAEIQNLELWRTRFEVASLATGQDGVLDKEFIYRNIFKLSETEIEKITEGRINDKKLEIDLEAMEQEMLTQVAVDGEKEETDDDKEEKPRSDPNIQRAAPNNMLNRGKKTVDRGDNSSIKQVFNTKKNGLDPEKGLQLLRRSATAPFGEDIFSKRQNLLKKHSAVVKSLENLEGKKIL